MGLNSAFCLSFKTADTADTEGTIDLTVRNYRKKGNR
jgi:hypothetical protein